MRKSPFHEDYVSNTKTDKRPTIRIPIEAYDQLNNYFEKNNLDFSKGIRSLCYDKLDTICNERKTFTNLEVFMLIPKMSIPYPHDEDFDVEKFTDNYFDILEAKSEIIAVVNTEVDFRSGFNHAHSFDEIENYKLSYEMKDFNAENFPMEILQNTNERCVYRTNENALNSFDSFKARMSAVFPNLDVNDCYFVRFPLNNYLDEFRNGQYMQRAYSDFHESVNVFEAVHGAIKYYCFINWDYSSESRNISFETYFGDETMFINDVYQTKDKELINSALSIVDGEDRRKRLENYKARLEDEVSFLNSLLERNP